MKTAENNVLLISDKKGFAVPAFNYSDIWEYKAILEAAELENAIVYTASNMRTAESMGVDYTGAWGKTSYILTDGNVINHLDHSRDVELCKAAVDAGYQSVMFDGSALSLEENIRKTKEVVEYAHERGVVVEAEIGKILGRGVEGTYEGNDFLVQVEDAVKLWEQTGVDSMAVGIGTAHGFYKEEPKINIQRLKEVNESVPIPLVLHGGTGVPYEVVQECIRNGMAKVNVGTLLHATYIERLRKALKTYTGNNVNDLMEMVKDAIIPKIREWIRVCGADQSRRMR
ncbi:MAG: class II fructose-bisphosphate aldolase [Eubacterium sp.]|nr:class II fructose-bisphosphate aldolase [Eubacterium sp.]